MFAHAGMILVLSVFSWLADRHAPANPSEIVVVSAVVFSSDRLENIRKILPPFADKNSSIINRIDKKLLGGFTVRVGDWFLDASLAYQLEELKDSLINK